MVLINCRKVSIEKLFYFEERIEPCDMKLRELISGHVVTMAEGDLNLTLFAN
jgi:hypothetical protein